MGRPKPTKFRSCAKTEHPHACGENLVESVVRNFGLGASPRVWGKRTRRNPDRPSQRSIPTRVGKTREIRQTRRRSAEHPHACGENEQGGIRTVHHNGASPRVWGKRAKYGKRAVEARSIPTRVGKTIGSATTEC